MSKFVLIKDERENKNLAVNKDYVIVLRPDGDHVKIHLEGGITIQSKLNLEELKELLA